MNSSVSQILLRLRAADRATVLIALAAVAVAIYSGWLATQYVDATSEGERLATEVRDLTDAIRALGDSDPNSPTDLDRMRGEFESQTGRFTFDHDDDVIALLSEQAKEARLGLGSVSAREAGSTVIGPLAYRIRKLDIRLEGRPERIYAFVDALSTAAPSVSVDALRMGGFGQAPWAVMELSFYIEPKETAGASADSTPGQTP